MSYLVYTKENCAFCVKAKKILKQHDIPYDEIDIEHDMSKEVFIEVLKLLDQPLTVPKIFDNEGLIGGYMELVEYMKEKGKR